MNQTNSSQHLNETSFMRPYFITSKIGFSCLDYLYFILAASGILTNTINIMVFFRIKLKDVRYKYLLWKSVANLIYLLIAFLAEFFVYCNNCPSTKFYFSAFYSIYVSIFLASCCALFRILVELVLSINTFSLLVRHNWFDKLSYKIVLTLIIIISVVLCTPNLPGYKISYEPMSDTYFVSFTSFFPKQAFKIILASQAIMRVVLNVFILGFVNLLNLIQFRKTFKIRRVGFTLDQENKIVQSEAKSK